MKLARLNERQKLLWLPLIVSWLVATVGAVSSGAGASPDSTQPGPQRSSTQARISVLEKLTFGTTHENQSLVSRLEVLELYLLDAKQPNKTILERIDTLETLLKKLITKVAQTQLHQPPKNSVQSTLCQEMSKNCPQDDPAYKAVDYKGIKIGISFNKFLKQSQALGLPEPLVLMTDAETFMKDSLGHPKILRCAFRTEEPLTVAGIEWIPEFDFVEDGGVYRLAKISGDMRRDDLNKVLQAFAAKCGSYILQEGNSTAVPNLSKGELEYFDQDLSATFESAKALSEVQFRQSQFDGARDNARRNANDL